MPFVAIYLAYLTFSFCVGLKLPLTMFGPRFHVVSFFIFFLKVADDELNRTIVQNVNELQRVNAIREETMSSGRSIE